MNIFNMLKGIGGEFEINRVLGAAGVAVYIVCVPLFVGWNVFIQGKQFGVVEFCAAYPAGLGVALGCIAGAVALKDRNVAVAQDVRAARTTIDDAAAKEPAPQEGPAGTKKDPIHTQVGNEEHEAVPIKEGKP